MRSGDFASAGIDTRQHHRAEAKRTAIGRRARSIGGECNLWIALVWPTLPKAAPQPGAVSEKQQKMMRVTDGAAASASTVAETAMRAARSAGKR